MDERLELDRDGIVGTFAHADAARGGVLVLGGSGGGHPGVGYGPALAAAGWSSLSLTYFGAPGLPQELHEIPLEYLERGLDALRARVPEGPVVVLARSRGTEAAQLLAVRRPEAIDALVLGVPGYVVVQAWPADGAAWTADGLPVAHHPDGWPTGHYPLDAPAAIEIERFPGPVLLVSAGADDIWPSGDFAEAIVRRRAGLPTTHLHYPDAGHGVGVLLPDEARADDPTRAALADAWPRVLAFLHGLSTPRPGTPVC